MQTDTRIRVAVIRRHALKGPDASEEGFWPGNASKLPWSLGCLSHNDIERLVCLSNLNRAWCHLTNNILRSFTRTGKNGLRTSL